LGSVTYIAKISCPDNSALAEVIERLSAVLHEVKSKSQSNFGWSVSVELALAAEPADLAYLGRSLLASGMVRKLSELEELLKKKQVEEASLEAQRRQQSDMQTTSTAGTEG